MKYIILAAVLIINTGLFSEYLQEPELSSHRVAVILILDTSGSMEKNDPNGLRFTGARLLSSLLEPGDSAAVILFSTQSIVLTNGFRLIRNERDRLELMTSVQAHPPDGYTDVKAAFHSARQLLRQLQRGRQAVYIVLLTDGEPEIKDPYSSYETETLEVAKSLGAPVLSIALTSSAQTPFLDRLAYETGGQVVSADDASDLLDAYLGVFGQIKDRTVLVTSGKDTSFILDPGLAPYINSMSFVMSRPARSPLWLDSPAGTPVQSDDPNVSFYFEDPEFVTISLGDPPPGTWTFQGSRSKEVRAYAILHSRLRIEMMLPGNYHQQSSPMLIEVRMTEELEDASRLPIIGEIAFSAVVTLPDGTEERLDRFYDDGTRGDRIAGDGIYSRLYVNTDQVGIYAIHVQGYKVGILVESFANTEVIPFPKLVLLEPTAQKEYSGQPLRISVGIRGASDFSLEATEIIASITMPSGGVQRLRLAKIGEVFSSDFFPTEEGEHQIVIVPKDVLYRGLPFEETTISSFKVTFVRTLSLEAGEWIPNGCIDARGRLPIYLRLFSPEAEILEFHLSGVEGLQAYPSQIGTQGGMTHHTLEVKTATEKLAPGFYQVSLESKGPSGPKFKVQPWPATFSFEVPTMYQRCIAIFRWGGISCFILLVFVSLLARKTRLATTPVLLEGTLRCWVDGLDPTRAQVHDLNLLSKNKILVGNTSDCDIQMPDQNSDVHAHYFALAAERAEDESRVVLEPFAEIWKGYSRLHSPIVLRHGDRFRLRGLNFQYLSDSGR